VASSNDVPHTGKIVPTGGPEADDDVSVLSHGSAQARSVHSGPTVAVSLATGNQTLKTSKTYFSYESLPSLPPYLKKMLDRNTKYEKYSNPHVLSHQYPKHLILRAVNEDGRKAILSDEEKAKLRTTTKHLRKKIPSRGSTAS
jgi:hypothetical protein